METSSGNFEATLEVAITSVQTSIDYVLPGDSEIELILRDETGRVLRVIKEAGKAGRNQIQLNELDLPAGFIYYQLNTKYGTKAKKMLRVE